MENVWILLNIENQYPCGVYSTEEKAHKALNKIVRDKLDRGWNFLDLEEKYWIEEMEVE